MAVAAAEEVERPVLAGALSGVLIDPVCHWKLQVCDAVCQAASLSSNSLS